MATETDDAALEPGPPASGTAEEAAFCGYDPLWVELPVLLKGRFNKEYGGIALFGPCPRCKHDDGINVFIPTTWATASASAAAGSPILSVTAFARPSAVEAEIDVQWDRVQWQPPDTTATGPEAQLREIVEVIACRCGVDFKHKPPSGKAGCGYWTYLRLQKGAIPRGD